MSLLLGKKNIVIIHFTRVRINKLACHLLYSSYKRKLFHFFFFFKESELITVLHVKMSKSLLFIGRYKLVCIYYSQMLMESILRAIFKLVY